jgi:glyoxylase-like metal-dependent hydrolase (beta-lactamase superfamily II)
MNDSLPTAGAPPSVDLGPVRVYFGEKNGKYPDGNQVIVRGRDAVAVFDTPLVANRIGEDFDRADLVILGHVHEDHMAGLRRVPRADVCVHEADVDAARSWEGLSRHYGYPPDVLARLKPKLERQFHYAPRPGARPFRDGAEWDLGGVRVLAIHMPGHTAGHCVLLVQPYGIAFIGDIDLSGFGPYYGDATSSLSDFRRTLERVAEVPARVWVTSHHKGIVTDRDVFLAALRAFAARIDEREAALLDLLRERPRSLDELVAIRVVYKPEADDVWIDAAERRSIEQHLDELARDGRIVARDDGRWRVAA